MRQAHVSDRMNGADDATLTDASTTLREGGDVQSGDASESTLSVHGTDRRRRGRIRFVYPEYGPVETLLGIGLFYLLVDRLTPVIVEGLASPFPSLGAETVRTLLAVSIWVMAGLSFLRLVLTQSKANPRRFESVEALNRFLAERRPTDRHYRFYLVLALLGGTTAMLAWETTLEVLAAMLPMVVTPAGELPAAITVGNAAVLVVFFLGFAASARGLDRLVIGGVREFLYRAYGTDRN